MWIVMNEHVMSPIWMSKSLSLIWMSHVPQLKEFVRAWDEVILHIWMHRVILVNASCHMYKWVVSHMNESCRTYEWVMLHMWMSHVTHMNESCHTYEWVMSHIWMSHVTHVDKACHAYEWVTSHIWMSHITRMNESCHTYEWIMSHMLSRFTHMKGLRLWMGRCFAYVIAQRFCSAKLSHFTNRWF